MALSEVSPIFLTSAEALQHRLEALGSPQARALAVEARECADVFRGWIEARPEDSIRVEAIKRFIDLNRRAMDLLAQGSPPSSRGRRPAPADRSGA